MGNVAYFVIGNVWLLVAIVLWLGRNIMETQPARYSFFDVGGPHSPWAYQALIVICLIFGLVLVIKGRYRPESAE